MNDQWQLSSDLSLNKTKHVEEDFKKSLTFISWPSNLKTAENEYSFVQINTALNKTRKSMHLSAL